MGSLLGRHRGSQGGFGHAAGLGEVEVLGRIEVAYFFAAFLKFLSFIFLLLFSINIFSYLTHILAAEVAARFL